MRLRNVETRSEMERVADDYITQGYKVQSRGEESMKMKMVQYGSLPMHILILILTVWWTFLLGNVAYASYKYIMGEEVLIKIMQ